MNQPTKNQILKTLVGSHAHGLASPESDYDYRGVFIQPTSELLSLGAKAHTASWIEGKEDDTSYELGHFLFLATKGNPSILEVFRAPVVDATELGIELRALFPHVWPGRGAFEAFRGYGRNQRTKMVENKDNRRHKYAVAWLRTLINAVSLFENGHFDMRIKDTAERRVMESWKAGSSYYFSSDSGVDLRTGEVMNLCEEWEEHLARVYERSNYRDKEPDIDRINEFLLKARRENW